MRFSPLVLSLLAALPASARARPAPPPAILPLRSLRLYETGVGYFERSGPLNAAGTNLPVPAGHLDDALKTLVVLTPDSLSRLHGIEFGSSASRGTARALVGLPLDPEAPISYRDLLACMKGNEVAVTSAGKIAVGRLIDLTEVAPLQPAKIAGAKEAEKDPPLVAKEPDLMLLVLTRDAELRRFRASQVESVRPTDGAFASRLDAALAAASSRGAQAQRMLRMMARSSAPVTLGYIAETPVWRTTYRMIFDDHDQGATLQGWALVHNDSDEDWREVQLHLVNGRPDSFLYPLAAPRYLRRELIHPDAELSTVPQLLESTADEQWGDNVLGGLSGAAVGEAYGSGGLGLVGHGSGGGGSGYGSGSGIGSSGVGVSSPVLTVGNLAGVANANGVESGALFTYTLADKIDLRAHGSALVPFVQQPVEVRPITLFTTAGVVGRSAARVVNSTRQTLPAGPIAFFGNGGFAGESGLDRLKPGERRFVQYGADLDVTLEIDSSSHREATRRLTFADDVLVEHYLKQSDVVYSVDNRSGHDRAVYLQLAVVDNAKVTGADDLDYDTVAARPLAIFRTAPGQLRKRAVKTEEGLSRATGIAALTEKRLLQLAAIGDLPRPERDAVFEAAAAQRRWEATDAALALGERDAKQVEADVQRLRDDLKTVGGDAKNGGPFVQRILAGEDRLGQLRRHHEELEAEKRTHRDELRRALAHLRP